MEQSSGRNNNFGFLRLLLAASVIVSHAPQLLDGNRSREILTQIFGTIPLGDVAVDGFFIISGYLITKSFEQRTSTLSYLKKRVFRIYPAFLASFWICVLAIAPLVGGRHVFSPEVLAGQAINSIFLLPPKIAGVFPGLADRMLNGSMWTISREFGCYIAVIFGGLVGLYSRELRVYLAAIVLVLLLGNAYMINSGPIRLLAVFGVGIFYYLYRDKVRFTHRGAIVSALMLVLLLFSKRWAETALAVFGGYLIFWIAFKLPVFRLSKMANKTDLSYGIYLYAWPLTSIVAWRFSHINPWLLSLIALAGATVAAYFSWTFIESPCLRMIRKGDAVRTHFDPGLTLTRDMEDARDFVNVAITDGVEKA